MENESSQQSKNESLATNEKRPKSTRKVSTEKWMELFYAWINSQVPGNANLDDSRESIYPDRW